MNLDFIKVDQSCYYFRYLIFASGMILGHLELRKIVGKLLGAVAILRPRHLREPLSSYQLYTLLPPDQVNDSL